SPPPRPNRSPASTSTAPATIRRSAASNTPPCGTSPPPESWSPAAASPSPPAEKGGGSQPVTTWLGPSTHLRILLERPPVSQLAERAADRAALEAQTAGDMATWARAVADVLAHAGHTPAAAER